MLRATDASVEGEKRRRARSSCVWPQQTTDDGGRRLVIHKPKAAEAPLLLLTAFCLIVQTLLATVTPFPRLCTCKQEVTWRRRSEEMRLFQTVPLLLRHQKLNVCFSAEADSLNQFPSCSNLSDLSEPPKNTDFCWKTHLYTLNRNCRYVLNRTGSCLNHICYQQNEETLFIHISIESQNTDTNIHRH